MDYNEDIFNYQYIIGDDQNKELDRISTVLQPNFRVPQLPVNNNLNRLNLVAPKKRSGGYSPLLENGSSYNQVSIQIMKYLKIIFYLRAFRFSR